MTDRSEYMKKWWAAKTPEEREAILQKKRLRQATQHRTRDVEATRARRSDRSRELRERGLCVSCGIRPSVPEKANCQPCRDRAKAWHHTEHGRTKTAQWNRDWKARNQERFREYGRDQNQRVKQSVIDLYGGYCACCGETELRFLTIDHVNDDGKADRERLGKQSRGTRFYQHLLKQPRRVDLQVLCWNCNMAKRQGPCPHRNPVFEAVEAEEGTS